MRPTRDYATVSSLDSRRTAGSLPGPTGEPEKIGSGTWQELVTAHPRIADAVAAARRGERVEACSREHIDITRRVRVDPAGHGVIEEIVHPHTQLQNLIATSWLNHTTPHDMVPALQQALIDVLPARVPTHALDVTVGRPRTGTPVPDFGYRYSCPTEGLTTWRDFDTRTATVRAALVEAMGCPYPWAVQVDEDTFAAFHRREIPAVRCSRCGEPLTNQHPAWVGTWTALDELAGPLCTASARTPNPDVRYSVSAPGAHRPQQVPLTGHHAPVASRGMKEHHLSSAPAVQELATGALAERLGIRITEATAERVIGTMPVVGNTQPAGVLHGGASAAFAETLASIGASLHAGPDRHAVGLDLSVTHHRPASSGRLTGVATPVHRGRTVATYEISITDDQGRRVTSCRLTCLLRP